jgi:hypothetical protein
VYEILQWEERNMKNNWYKKGLVVVLGIIILFVGVAVAPSINAGITVKKRYFLLI